MITSDDNVQEPSPLLNGEQVAVVNLTYRYRRHSPPVLKDFTAQFRPGTLSVLTGPSGSGKSTLLYLLALMLRPVQGNVSWGARVVHALPDGARAALRATQAGFVFQDAMLDPARTVLDNVLEPSIYSGLDRDVATKHAETLLKKFGVAHRLNHRPGEISGGQAQRVALCRALVTYPNIIFGDEPTGNLDRDSAELVWSALESQAKAGATVIVATHDMRLAKRADQQIVLE